MVPEKSVIDLKKHLSHVNDFILEKLSTNIQMVDIFTMNMIMLNYRLVGFMFLNLQCSVYCFVDH